MSLRLLAIMRQHDVPSVTMNVMGPNGPSEREITREEAERDSAGMQALVEACAKCPAAVIQGAPACSIRVDYPVDEVALTVVREAMEVNAAQFEGEHTAFVRSLVSAGDCDGTRMLNIVRTLQAEPIPVGQKPVSFDLDGRPLEITPYMLLEHMFFRSHLDVAETTALREWYRSFYIAVGNRIADGPGDQDANADALFGSSPSLQDLAALGALVKAAQQNGWAVQLDG
jgi:hypothetical protein